MKKKAHNHYKLESLMERLSIDAAGSKLLQLCANLQNSLSSMEHTLEDKEQAIEIMLSNLHPRTHFGYLQSKNDLMQHLFSIAQKYALTNWPLLILGERGTGKEAFARIIHMKSAQEGPFVLYEEIRKEQCECPAEATLFFAELSLVGPDLQKMAFRYIKNNMRPDVRIILSAEKEADVEPRLISLLKADPIEIIPLRARKEDILSMIDVFIREFTRNEKNISHFSPSALIKLLEYPWPGNVSELKLEIKRILIDYRDRKYYTIDALPEKIIGESMKELFSIIRKEQSLPRAMETLERKMVLEALIKNEWNKSRVSRELGISRSGLIQKVQKYHIAPAR